jgi:hypothetical protein
MSRDDDVNFGQLGSTPAFQYWNDLVNVSMNLMEQNAALFSGVFQKIATSNGDPTAWSQQFWDTWMGWLSTTQTAMLFPWQWMARYQGDVPSMVFMVDGVAETQGPSSVMTPSDPQGLTVAATDLFQAGGPGVISAEAHVQVGTSQDGNRLEVSLVNLRAAAPAPGLYVGIAYAYETPVRRPLALLHVYVHPASASHLPPGR